MKTFKGLKIDSSVYFFLIAALIFIVHAVIQGSANESVKLTSEVRDRLVENFEMLEGRKAQTTDIQKIEDDFITEELLFKEALNQGIHLTDSTTRSSLLQKIRYKISGVPVTPTPEEMLEFYTEHLEYYTTEKFYSVRQVFFEEMPDDIEDKLAKLNAGESIEADTYWIGDYFPGYGLSALRSIFGNDISASFDGYTDGVWEGPFQTQRGWHLLRVEERFEPKILPFSEVEQQVERDYQHTKNAETLDTYIQQLKEKYDVEIEE
ncbi:peptidyl-prolyl cis-trans isomerase [Hirschia litorea]|uniref:Parvulin-like PPIase n=1 Tax=Hirschia litorea TaxID=1199156 RepID=A0ABW2IPK3_9PROT